MGSKILKNEEGFVLILSMLILGILIIIGIAATTTTVLELQISGNDKVHKQTFYSAEAGASLGATVVDESLLCPDGFTSVAGETYADLNAQVRIFEQNSNSLAIYQNNSTLTLNIAVPSEADVAFPIANLAKNTVTKNVGFHSAI